MSCTNGMELPCFFRAEDCMPGDCAVLNRRRVTDLLGFPETRSVSGERGRQQKCRRR